MIAAPETRAQYQNAVDAIDSDSGGLPTWLAVDTPDLSTMLTDLDRLARIEGMAARIAWVLEYGGTHRMLRDLLALLRPSAPAGRREETT